MATSSGGYCPQQYIEDDKVLYGEIIEIEDVRIPISETPKIETVSLSLPSQTNGKFKTYMDYRAITSRSSPQYKLQQQAWSDDKGFRRVGDDYCIALGSFYGTQIGTRYKIVLDTGYEFTGILSDCKANKHTNSTHQYIPKNGNIVEFVVDTRKMEKLSKKMGDVSYSGFSGGVVSIERIVA